jgi:threonine/homoserine/homoserine lactone efflux protein
VANMTSAKASSLLNGEPNLTMTERGAYIAVGLGLAATAVKPRPNPLLNVVALLGGSYLAWRGYMGNCPVKAALFGPETSSGRISQRA